MQTVKHIQRVYYLVISLFWLAISLPLALFILLIQARGMSLFQIGVIMGVYSLTIVLLEVPTGGLADAVGRKRVTVVAYSCIMIAGMILLGAFSFPVFLLACILNGVGRALSSGALDAWFIDALQEADPEIDLQPILAKAGTFILLALGTGTLVGSLIPNFFSHLPADGTAIITPLSVTYLFSLVIFILLLAATIFLVREKHVTTNSKAWVQGVREAPLMIRTAFTLSGQNSTLLLLLGAAVASGLALAGLESFWQPHFAGLLGDIEGRTFFFGLVMGGNFLVGMFGNMLATPLSRLLRKRYGLVCAIFQGMRGLILIGLAMQATPHLAVLLFWLVYLNMGVVNSPHSTLLNQEIPAKHRSSMLSIESLASYLGAIIGGFVLGYVAEYISIGAAWTIAGSVLVVSLLLYWQIDARQQKKLSQEKGHGQEEIVFQAG
jgi:MFS family permease